MNNEEVGEFLSSGVMKNTGKMEASIPEKWEFNRKLLFSAPPEPKFYDE